MFKKILLPLNLDGGHRQAIDSAISLAKHHDSQIVLLHIVELLSGMPLDEEREFYEQLRAASRTRLAEFEQRLTVAGVAVQVEIVVGSSTSEILRLAVDGQAELIVLTSPQVDPENPGGIATSKCWKISALTGCPVLLVK